MGSVADGRHFAARRLVKMLALEKSVTRIRKTTARRRPTHKAFTTFQAMSAFDGAAKRGEQRWPKHTLYHGFHSRCSGVRRVLKRGFLTGCNPCNGGVSRLLPTL